MSTVEKSAWLTLQAFRNACAKQVREYRVQYKRWLAAVYTVYGLSADEPQAQKSWSKVRTPRGVLCLRAQRLRLPFPLLCDPSRTLIHQLTGPWNFTRRGCVPQGGSKVLTAVTL